MPQHARAPCTERERERKREREMYTRMDARMGALSVTTVVISSAFLLFFVLLLTTHAGFNALV